MKYIVAKGNNKFGIMERSKEKVACFHCKKFDYYYCKENLLHWKVCFECTMNGRRADSWCNKKSSKIFKAFNSRKQAEAFMRVVQVTDEL